MSEKSIKVTIAGRIYPVTVKPEEEERVRSAAKRVDDSVKHLLDNYAVKDKQDLLAMTALQLATALLDIDSKDLAAADESHLEEIESMIESML
jgi:cell division protein ZapA